MKQESKLQYFKELLEQSKAARDEAFSELASNRAQYLTGHVTGEGGAAPSMVRNITYELIETEISTAIPAPRVTPKIFSAAREKNAAAVNHLLTSLRDELPFESLNDRDERSTYVDGATVFFAEWDHGKGRGRAHGGARVTLLGAEDFYPQPGVFEVEDMDWFFLRFSSTPAEVAATYGATVEAEADGTCSVFVCFYRDEEGAICRFVFCGDAVLSDLTDFYARKRYCCKDCGVLTDEPPKNLRCACGGTLVPESDRVEILSHPAVSLEGKIIPAGTPVPRYRPRHYPVVIRRNIARRGSLLGHSDCAFIRWQQREINRVESHIHEKIMSAGTYPFKPESVDFQYDDSIGTEVLNIPEGKSREDFGVLDLLPSLAEEQRQSDRLYEQAKRILGITAAYQGAEDVTATSGVAKQAQIAQAAGRLDSKRVMKHAAYADLDRILFELYLAFADEPREAAFVDAFGRMQNSTFHRYDFLTAKGEGYAYDDDYLFAADRNGENEAQREELWKLNIENFKAGAMGNPESPQTVLCYWQLQERAHYPHAKENVEYFTELLKGKEREKIKEEG